jgi:molecular chaperone DnaK
MSEALLSVIARRVLATSNQNLDRLRWFTGIDLGTTNSTAALVDAQAVLDGRTNDAVRLVPVRQSTENGIVDDTTLPSVVAEVEPGTWWVGKGAKEARRRGLGRGRQIFYSTKSEMGLGGEPFYPMAPDALNAPYKVAGRVLGTLRDAVELEVGPEALESLIVTVPASFQLAARQDTFRAASELSLKLGERALLDEPNAALLDYLLTTEPKGPGTHLDLQSPRAVLVFDFGGGTCDVSIVRVQADPNGGRLSLSNLAISRYERLGGDNIDAAIAEEILLPKLLRPSGLDRLDLSWAHKRDYVLPQLLNAAESLKLAVLQKQEEERACGRSTLPYAIVAEHVSIAVDVPSRQGASPAEFTTHVLKDPSLTLQQFEETLAPFLDPDFLFPRGTEMNQVLSIFTPVTDALERSGLRASDIDGILLAGGSSLIPQVQEALQSEFPRAVLLRFPDAERTMSAVARGAALHSFFLHGLGTPLLKPIAQETIGILTRWEGFAPLIPAGTELPYPADGSFARYDGLVVPRELHRETQIVLAADNADKVLSMGTLPATLGAADEAITVSYRLDANKILTVRSGLASDPAAFCELTLENPLCSTASSSDRARRIRELEQRTSTSSARAAGSLDVVDGLEELGWLYYEECRYEQALDAARSAQRQTRRANPDMLYLMGLTYEALDRRERAEECYSRVMEANPESARPWFNRSLLRQKEGRREDALVDITQAMRLQPNYAPYLALRASILQALSRPAEAEAELTHAVEAFTRRPPRGPFERSWARLIAKQTNNASLIAGTATIEPEARVRSYDPATLPAERGTLATRRMS